MDAVQGSFDEAKKEFNLPSVCIQHDNLICCQIEPVCY